MICMILAGHRGVRDKLTLAPEGREISGLESLARRLRAAAK
jgi:hypothetical protein